jgi:hypothetical protein
MVGEVLQSATAKPFGTLCLVPRSEDRLARRAGVERYAHPNLAAYLQRMRALELLQYHRLAA